MNEMKPPKVTPWATSISTRRPQFKQHGTLGHARAAVTNQKWYGPHPEGEAVIWKWDGTEWQKFHEEKWDRRK